MDFSQISLPLLADSFFLTRSMQSVVSNITITGIFYGNQESDTPLLLTTNIPNSCAILLRRGATRGRLSKGLNGQTPILAAAQGADEATTLMFATRSRTHGVQLLNLRDESGREIANFSQERKGDEPMAVGMSDGGIVQALWRSNDGRLLFKQMSLRGEDMGSMDLRGFYWKLVDQG